MIKNKQKSQKLNRESDKILKTNKKYVMARGAEGVTPKAGRCRGRLSSMNIRKKDSKTKTPTNTKNLFEKSEK